MIRSAYSEGFVGFASSKVGEDSLSHHVDLELGVYMVDRFTYHLLEFLETIAPNASKKLSEMAKVCPKSQCISTPGRSSVYSSQIFSSRTPLGLFFCAKKYFFWPFSEKSSKNFLILYISVNRFELLNQKRRHEAKVTDFFGSERKMITINQKPVKTPLLTRKVENSSQKGQKMTKMSFDEAVQLSTGNSEQMEKKTSLSRFLSVLVLAPLTLTFLLTFK